MVTVLLVDDEKAALRMLQRRLKAFPQAQVKGSFTQPLAALEKIRDIRPNVVFLDINMPELKGLDAAERIKEASPRTQIVFVTAHERYAVDAFELEALDYLLKPVSKARFAKTFERVLQKVTHETAANQLKITTMGAFTIAWPDSAPIKWRSKKTRELAAFLVLKQGKEIAKSQIIESLWPEHDEENAANLLYKNIHYIRKSLAEAGITKSSIELAGKYILKVAPEVCQDRLLFTQAVSKMNKMTSLTELEALEKSYTGEFFHGEEASWVRHERTRLRGLYHTVVAELSKKYVNCSLYEKTENLLLGAHHNDPYDEHIMMSLLKLYVTTQQNVKAAKRYLAYKILLQTELGVPPSESIQKIMS